jgi:hypothetical protein
MLLGSAPNAKKAAKFAQILMFAITVESAII